MQFACSQLPRFPHLQGFVKNCISALGANFCLLCGQQHASLSLSDHLADVSRNGALRDAQPSRILERTARTKVDRYRAGYAALQDASNSRPSSLRQTTKTLRLPSLRFL